MRRTFRAGAFLLVVLTPTLSDSTASDDAQARPRLIQSIDIQIPAPPTPVSISGKRRLAYELHITNFRSRDVALTRLEVLDADRKNRLGDFGDAQLAGLLGGPGPDSSSGDRRVIGAGMRVVAYMWLGLDDGVAPPSRLQHRITLDLIQPSGHERTVVEDQATLVRNAVPVVLDAPLRGGPWVALYDPMMAHGHRTSIYTINGRARIPARFAIDWVRLDDAARHARGDESKIANWLGFGAEVLAVADGVVANAMDDMPEDASMSNSSPPVALENASGNHLTLDLGGGRYAFYEHLKHGSIRVRAGDRVKSGQVLGLLGNSGSSSSGPHLHFHVADTSSDLAAEGLPYVFKSFEVLGAFAAIETFDSGKRWSPVPDKTGGMRELELPAANTVILFRPAEVAP